MHASTAGPFGTKLNRKMGLDLLYQTSLGSSETDAWLLSMHSKKLGLVKYNIIKESRRPPQPLDHLAPNSVGGWSHTSISNERKFIRNGGVVVEYEL